MSDHGDGEGEELSLSARLEALTEYYAPEASEKRMTERLDRLFAPMERDAARHQEILDQMANPSRPALQPERNGNDDFQRILQDFPWVN